MVFCILKAFSREKERCLSLKWQRDLKSLNGIEPLLKSGRPTGECPAFQCEPLDNRPPLFIGRLGYEAECIDNP